MTLANKIRNIRLGLGLTMEEFAERIDDNSRSGTVANWETGKNAPNPKRLKRIAELAGISVEELTSETQTIKIGEQIKRIRKTKGFTQNELAEFSGLSRSYLSDIENNRKNPSVETVKKLAESFNMKLVISFEPNESIGG